MNDFKEIERSIIKKFRKSIWSKFVRAIQEFELISPDDKIMVCISGGKDSFLLAKCIEELQKHGKFYFDVKYVVMNPGYKEDVLNSIKDNAKVMNLDIEIFNSDMLYVCKNAKGIFI